MAESGPRDPSVARSARAANPSQRSKVRRVLEGCLSTIDEALAPSLPQVCREALEQLARERDKGAMARAARVLLLTQQHEFVTTCLAAIREELLSSLAEFVNDPGGAREETNVSISLVDYGDMEERVLFERIDTRQRNAAEDELSLLNARIANMIGVLEIKPNENPLRPVVLFRGLLRALERSRIVRSSALVVVEAFDVPITDTVRELYRRCNELLEGDGVSADVRYVRASEALAMRGGGSSGAWPVHRGPASRLGPVTAGDGAAAEGNWFGAMLELYRRGGAEPVAPGGGVMWMPTQPGGPAVAASGPMTLAPVYAGPVYAGSPYPGVSPDLLSAINELQRTHALALTARENAAAREQEGADDAAELEKIATRKVDKLTIEIVSMLFERINADAQVPEPIRTLLLRLQLPFLKIALNDPEAFIAQRGPARELIDRVAMTSVGWTAQGEESQRYLQAVEKTVQMVVAGVNEGPELFKRALDEFEAYLESENTRDDNPVARARRALAAAETREINTINATIQVRRAFDDVGIESYLREFLLGPWVRVLVVAAERDGEDAPLVERLRQLVPDLVWSVQPKLERPERQRLLQMIPALLAGLRSGLELIEHPAEEVSAFFGRLMTSHAQAVKAFEIAKTGRADVVDTVALQRRLLSVSLTQTQGDERGGGSPIVVPAEALRQAVSRGGLDLDVVAPISQQPTMKNEVAGSTQGFATYSDLNLLKVGAWYELDYRDRLEKVQLRWVSPRKTVWLFTASGKTSGFSFGPDVLTGYLKLGKLKPVERAPLFQRAVEDLVTSFDASANRDAESVQ